MSVIVQNEIADTIVPNPAAGKIALFIDETDSKLKGKKPDGSVVFIGTTPVHADTHHTGGTDALAPADIGAAPSVHNHDGTDITTGTVGASRLPNTSSTTAGIVPTTSGSATGDKLRVKADGTLEWYTPALDEAKVSKLYESDGGAAAVEVDAAGDVTCNGALLIGDSLTTNKAWCCDQTPNTLAHFYFMEKTTGSSGGTYGIVTIDLTGNNNVVLIKAELYILTMPGQELVNIYATAENYGSVGHNITINSIYSYGTPGTYSVAWSGTSGDVNRTLQLTLPTYAACSGQVFVSCRSSVPINGLIQYINRQ